MENLREGIVEHSSFLRSCFEQFAADRGHLGAADADEIEVVTCLFKGGYEFGTVGVRGGFGSAEEDSICFFFRRP